MTTDSIQPLSIAAPVNPRKAFRGALLDFVDDPFYVSEAESVRYIPDGLLVLKDGRIEALGHYEDLKDAYADVATVAYPGMVLTPGLIDTHIHFPQTEMIAAYGEQLLEWLSKYTFPTERKFQSKDYAQQVAAIF